ncbi:MAG: hypothetical protein RMJ36_03650 [Candidatus Calescibacterium sp.]|nr:hypothetical protein [Candidatus Calescibacterium sp.]MDW8132732.1 hypothetical protein [Candidatus Calescibacterium sp.]
MNNLRELEELRNIIGSNLSQLGKSVLDYIFAKIRNHRYIKGLREISYQYYLLLQDKLFLSKVYRNFYDENITQLFSIDVVDVDANSEEVSKIFFEVKPKYSVFDPKSILSIAEFVESFVSFKKMFIEFTKDRDGFKELRNFISSTSNFKDLLNTVFYFIDRKGNIRDDSTPELKKIRQEIYNLTKVIPQKLDEFIRENGKYLVSNGVSYRNGRFVVLLNSQYVSNFDGIVQDYSWTHKTAFFEPHFVIDLNNRFTVLQSLEKIEIQKIITHIFDKIVENIDNLANVFRVCSFLEFFNSYFRISPYFCSVDFSDSDVEVLGLINPLVKNCVPIDVVFKRGLMIVGPNSGGKSVALKSIALCVLFSNIGLPVFAKFARIPYLKVFYDVPDPQSISDGISTFSGHVKYWKFVIDNIDRKSLVIMDEPASGTDPFEASAITIAIIEYLLSKGALVVFSTHYNNVKNYFYGKIDIASVSFDFNNNRSDYYLVYDIMLPSLPTNLLKDLPYEIIHRIQEIKDEFGASGYEKKLENIFLNIMQIQQEVKQKENLIKTKLMEIERMKQEIKNKVKNEIFTKLYTQYSKEIQLLIQNWEKELEKLKSKGVQKLEKKIRSIKNFDLNDYLSSLEDIEESISVNVNDFVKIKIFDEIGKVVEVRGNRVTVEVNGRTYTVGLEDIKKVMI